MEEQSETKKKEEKTRLLLYKNKGKFYNYKGQDAYIMQYLFGYKVLKNTSGGFPDVTLNKVLNTLEDKKISYQIIFTEKDPIIKEYKKNNHYEKYLDLALENIDFTKRMDLSVDKLKDASFEQLEKTIRVLEECLK